MRSAVLLKVRYSHFKQEPMKNFAVLCVGVAFFQLTDAQQAPPLTAEQRDNISAVYAKCAAYFTIVRAGMNNSGYTEMAEAHRKLALDAMKRSLELASSSRTSEMAQRVVEARYSTHREAMLRDIDNDFSNISILLNKYGQECALALSNQSDFIRKYLSSER